MTLITGTAATASNPSLVSMKQGIMFIIGFSIVFVALGSSATAFGRLLLHNNLLLVRISGAVVTAMALFMIVSTVSNRVWLQHEWHFHLSSILLKNTKSPEQARVGVALVVGAAFAFGWTPCLSPILASILAIASSKKDIVQGGVLLGAYSAGIGVPLLFSGLVFSKFTKSSKWLKQHSRSISLGSAVVLGVLGVLLVTNQLSLITIQINNIFQALELSKLIQLG